MTIYIMTTLLAIMLSWGIKVNKKSESNNWLSIFLLCILILGLSIVVGYRDGVGTDFWEYRRMFFVYKNYSFKSILKIKEPGIRILIKLCSFISDDYSFYMFICALITTALPIIVLYRHSENFTVSMTLYLFLNYLTQCNGMRQALAMAIIFMGYKFIRDKNFWRFLIYPLVASVFHIAALFIIPIYFIYTSKPSIGTTAIILFATLLIRFSYDWLARTVELFSGEAFEDSGYASTSVNFLRIIAMGAPVVLTAFLSKEAIQNKSVIFNMLLANACVYLCMGGSAYFARLGMFTDMFLCLAIPAVVSEYDTRSKEAAFLCILTCYAVFFVVNTMRTGNLVPYQFIGW